MALSVFDDKARKPKEADLERELGRSMASWRALTGWLAEQYDPLLEEWTYSGAQWGWSARLKHKKRAVLYLTPGRKHFLVGLVLGEKAVKAALESKIPATVAELIRTARKYPEGRGIRLEIRHKRDLEPVKLLARAKMST